MRIALLLLVFFAPNICVAEQRLSPAESAMDYENNKTEERLTISQTLDNGRYIVLSDDSKYEISPRDRSISSGWLVPADVTVKKSIGEEYPLLIINEWTHAKVRARVANPDPEKNRSY